MIIIRLLLLPFKIALALVGVTFRTGRAVARVPVRTTRFVVRVGSIRGWVLFVVGIALGLLLAPVTGQQLRAKLQAMLDGGGSSDDQLQAKVTFELAHAPRT